MGQFLENLWIKHRTAAIVLGVVLLPITLAIFGIKLYMLYNLKAAEKSLNKAQKTDDSLKAQEDSLKKASDELLSEANKSAQRIEDRKNDGVVDLDWQNKRKD